MEGGLYALPPVPAPLRPRVEFWEGESGDLPPSVLRGDQEKPGDTPVMRWEAGVRPASDFGLESREGDASG